MLLLLVAFNKTTVARYDADRRGIQSIILARCPNLPDHFTPPTNTSAKSGARLTHPKSDPPDAEL